MLGGFSALSYPNAMTGSCGAGGAKQGEQTDFMRVCAGAHMCEHVAARGRGSRRQAPESLLLPPSPVLRLQAHSCHHT